MAVTEYFATELHSMFEQDQLYLENLARIEELQIELVVLANIVEHLIRLEVLARVVEHQIGLEALAKNFALHLFVPIEPPAIR